MHLLLFTYGQKPNINTFFRSCFHAKVEKTNFFKHSNKLISHLNKLGFVLAIFPLTSFEIIIRPCHHRLCSKLVRTEVKYSISWMGGTFTLTIMSRINYAKINGCRQTWDEFLYLVVLCCSRHCFQTKERPFLVLFFICQSNSDHCQPVLFHW